MNLNKYQEEVKKEQSLRDALILGEIALIYDIIRTKSLNLASKIKAKTGDNTNWFNSGNRTTAFAKKVNDTLKDDYLDRDTFVKTVYAEEYRTSYFYAKYATENYGLSKGYNVKLARYTKEQFQRALNYSMSVISDIPEMTIRRKIATKQVYTSIVSGIGQGLSIEKINDNIDIVLGFRDSKTKEWIKDLEERKGQQYKTKRLIRTEIARIRNDASRDQWLNEQDIVKSYFVDSEVFDNRIRRQSASMDGDRSNDKGEFLYPDGQWHQLGRSGNPAWDIHDRGEAISVDPEFPPESKIQRDPKTGRNSIQPYTNANEWIKVNNLKKNIYGEILF